MKFDKLVKVLLESQKPVMQVDKSGNKRWEINGVMHREDGPAAEYSGGRLEWYIDGYIHREDGPAIIQPDSGPGKFDGVEIWCTHNKIHREDGPAVMYSNGNVKYYIKGDELPKREFDKYLEHNKQEKLNKELTSDDNPVFDKDFLDEL